MKDFEADRECPGGDYLLPDSGRIFWRRKMEMNGPHDLTNPSPDELRQERSNVLGNLENNLFGPVALALESTVKGIERRSQGPAESAELKAARASLTMIQTFIVGLRAGGEPEPELVKMSAQMDTFEASYKHAVIEARAAGMLSETEARQAVATAVYGVLSRVRSAIEKAPEMLAHCHRSHMEMRFRLRRDAERLADDQRLSAARTAQYAEEARLMSQARRDFDAQQLAAEAAGYETDRLLTIRLRREREAHEAALEAQTR